jgi:protein phosphatase
MMAAGRLTPEEAKNHPYRSVVTRAIGLESSVDVDTTELELRAGDRLMLCSDGLSSMIDDGAIAEILDGRKDPAEAARALVEAANAAGGDDNITVVIVDADDE